MGKEFNFEEEFMKNLAREELIKMFNEKDQRIAELEEQLKEKEKNHIKDKINLLEFLKANFADVYMNGVLKIDCYDRVKYSNDIDDIIDREIGRLNGEWE